MRRDKPRKAVPHLFSKLVIWWCVIFGTGACYYALRIESRTSKSPSATLGVILGFLGGELLLLCLRTVLKEQKTRSVSESDTGKGDDA